MPEQCHPSTFEDFTIKPLRASIHSGPQEETCLLLLQPPGSHSIVLPSSAGHVVLPGSLHSSATTGWILGPLPCLGSQSSDILQCCHHILVKSKA